MLAASSASSRSVSAPAETTIRGRRSPAAAISTSRPPRLPVSCGPLPTARSRTSLRTLVAARDTAHAADRPEAPSTARGECHGVTEAIPAEPDMPRKDGQNQVPAPSRQSRERARRRTQRDDGGDHDQSDQGAKRERA